MTNPENIIPPKKGEIRNPNGRPVGSKNRSTILRKWLECNDKIKNPLTQQEEVMSVEDTVILALIAKARKGDVAAIKEILDSNYGKLTDKTDLTTNGENINPPEYDLSKLSVEALKELKDAKVSGK